MYLLDLGGEGVIELDDGLVGVEALALYLRPDGETVEGGAAGQGDVEHARAEHLGMDGAALEGLALRLVDGDGEREAQGNLRERAHRVGDKLLCGVPVIADDVANGGFQHLPFLLAHLDGVLAVIEIDRDAIHPGLQDRPQRAVREAMVGHVGEQHHACALHEAQLVIGGLVRGLHIAVGVRRVSPGLRAHALQLSHALVVDGGCHAVRGAQPQVIPRCPLAVGDGALVEVADAVPIADAGAVELVDELGVPLAHHLGEDMRLEAHALPQRGLEGVAVIVTRPQLHEHLAVIVGHDRRELEEVAHEHDLLPARYALRGEHHVHDALEQVDAAHGNLVDDDDLGLVEHLARERLAVLIVRVEHAEADLQGAVDGRAVMQVLRGYPRRGHGEIGNLALLKLLDECVEHVAFARARVSR